MLVHGCVCTGLRSRLGYFAHAHAFTFAFGCWFSVYVVVAGYVVTVTYGLVPVGLRLLLPVYGYPLLRLLWLPQHVHFTLCYAHIYVTRFIWLRLLYILCPVVGTRYTHVLHTRVGYTFVGYTLLPGCGWLHTAHFIWGCVYAHVDTFWIRLRYGCCYLLWLPHYRSSAVFVTHILVTGLQLFVTVGLHCSYVLLVGCCYVVGFTLHTLLPHVAFTGCVFTFFTLLAVTTRTTRTRFTVPTHTHTRLWLVLVGLVVRCGYHVGLLRLRLPVAGCLVVCRGWLPVVARLVYVTLRLRLHTHTFPHIHGWLHLRLVLTFVAYIHVCTLVIFSRFAVPSFGLPFCGCTRVTRLVIPGYVTLPVYIAPRLLVSCYLRLVTWTLVAVTPRYGYVDFTRLHTRCCVCGCYGYWLVTLVILRSHGYALLLFTLRITFCALLVTLVVHGCYALVAVTFPTLRGWLRLRFVCYLRTVYVLLHGALILLVVGWLRVTFGYGYVYACRTLRCALVTPHIPFWVTVGYVLPVLRYTFILRTAHRCRSGWLPFTPGYCPRCYLHLLRFDLLPGSRILLILHLIGLRYAFTVGWLVHVRGLHTLYGLPVLTFGYSSALVG